MSGVKLLHSYKNGNCNITIFDDGTKIMEVPDNEPVNLQFPNSIDLNITNRCTGGCPYCYLNATDKGLDGNLLNPENQFLWNLPKGIEVALNANELNHPELWEFCERLKHQGVIVNMTINAKHLKGNLKTLKKFQDLGYFKAVGISVPYRFNPVYFSWVKKANKILKNAVVHIIAGACNEWFEPCKEFERVLILGFKDKGRGTKFKIHKALDFEYCIKNVQEFKGIVAFDNLALEQLRVRDWLPSEIFEQIYFGENGTQSMYIDLVSETFSLSSLSENKYDIIKDGDGLEKMFQIVKTLKN